MTYQALESNYEGQQHITNYVAPVCGALTFRDTQNIYSLLGGTADAESGNKTLCKLIALALDHGSVQARSHIAMYLGVDYQNPVICRGILDQSYESVEREELLAARDSIRNMGDMFRSNGMPLQAIAATSLIGYDTRPTCITPSTM